VVPEAPIDGELYGRQDTDWRPIVFYPNGMPPDSDIGDQLIKQGLDDGDAVWMPSAVPPPVLPALEFHLGRSTTSLPMARGRKLDQDIHLPTTGLPPGYWVMSQAVWLMRRGTVETPAPSGGWSCELLYADSGGEGRHVHPDRNAELRVGISGKRESNLLVCDQQPSATCMDPASGSFPGGSDIWRRRYRLVASRS
jgi:hypothetical protein